MAAESWTELRDLFNAALQRSGAERAAYLDEACGDDQRVRRQVEAMVEAHEQTASLEEPAASRAGDGDPAKGLRVGRYEVRSTIASGGMGTVYEAAQDQPHRLVALKVLQRGVASRQALKRFRYEAEILGRLRHPNIAQVYEAGTYDEGEGGRPFFAMELVKGSRLLQYCAAKDLSTRTRLELFAKVCDAVQFAHHKGVIHRDLKPDNILVDDFGEPKILDFGVARATDSDIQATTLQTDIGQLIGTVPYMSPEQVAGDPSELDTRSDVYSLGVVLYELLADRLPHDLRDKSIPEAVRIIGEQDPTPLSSISRIYRGDLDTITAKALVKEKDRRYQSAAELAADLRHYLGDEPIVARPASALYQARKFARRNKTLVGGVVAVFVVLVGGIVGVSLALADSRSEAERAEMINVFLEEILASSDPWEGQRKLTVVELLDDAADRIESRFASHPDVASQLHFTIARAYQKLGKLNKAVEHMAAAVDLGERSVGEEDPHTIEAMFWLADLHARRRQPDQAIPIARRVRDLCRRVYGPTHEKTIDAIGLLGGTLSRSGDPANFPEAERLLKQCRELAERELSPDVRDIADIHDGLAYLYIQTYRFQEAEPKLTAALEWFHKEGWEREASKAMTNLAWVKGLNGDTERALTLAQEAYEIRRKWFGPDHYFTTNTRHAIAWILEWGGDLEGAQEILEQLLPILQARTGKEHPVGVSFWLARVRLLRGEIDAAEALPLVERFVNVNTDPMNPFYGEAGLTAQALCLVRLGRFVEARAVMDRHPQQLIEAVAEDHHERRLHLRTLAEMYEGLGEPEKAAKYQVLLREA
ncbi:MAG: protein kinase domain-containing protein [Planctomycetota bacterium]|jgi:tetratricopeptide (TPR) repeat protein